ncbi:hypothetical protein N7499_011755 [Penicillium canescens]|uniref:Uncharacterized protein n=1 Tax=Penicillium canescens TaxID=5083 RepID=A0AAD6IKM5_PENCN|nr:uncharacterized protein N7446_007016 [Penicillium canescens]KAJ5991212.1 hypothetical protein N7522_011419 [Penicillium canescens]KAJ6049657.1 hypothetical protein N7444_006373 [Penicillium canescens]KAJ6052374.1 hypothetical protein N7460_002908 [Penicillium canescens]KAJ6062896.1 hypothetical protein N7446_007016 [Penicillium canescens]KAJ6069868.1 hypothetical protein N7499_011755 [Penicillium canescens]
MEKATTWPTDHIQASLAQPNLECNRNVKEESEEEQLNNKSYNKDLLPYAAHTIDRLHAATC